MRRGGSGDGSIILLKNGHSGNQYDFRMVFLQFKERFMPWDTELYMCIDCGDDMMGGDYW